MPLDWIVAGRFLTTHPGEAARLLERMPAEDVASLIERMDAQQAAGIIGTMVRSAAVRELSRVTPSRAAEILAFLPVETASALLRPMEPRAREELMAVLPTERRVPIQRVLRYPVGSAGSLMDPGVVSFHRSRRVQEVLEEFRTHGTELRYYVYVVDDELTLQGVLSLRELASSPPNEFLSSIMSTEVESVPARARKNAIRRHPGWRRYPLLPVVDDKRHLVGIFRYETFQQLTRAADEERAPDPLSLALALGELFWLGAAGLFRGLEKVEDE
jgi:magnesium transporter